MSLGKQMMECDSVQGQVVGYEEKKEVFGNYVKGKGVMRKFQQPSGWEER
jgi:hypothetical protein